MIALGIITRAHGIRGEIRLATELSSAYWKGINKVVVCGKEYNLVGIRFTAADAILHLEGLDDRNAAEALRGNELYLPEGVRPALPDDVFLLSDLIGSKVYLDGSEDPIGVVDDVLRNGAADVWSVRGVSGNKNLMVPQIKGLVVEYALEVKRVVLSRTVFPQVVVYED